jgi:predicted acyl esterase
LSAGETPAQSTYAPGIVTQIAQYRSAYYQTAMIAHDMPSHETPVLDVQGWTDNLFPEAQGASMVEKLRAADSGWPAFLYVSDLGHPAANNTKLSEWSVINAAATDFLNLHVRRVGGGNPSMTYQEQVVTCDSAAGEVYANNSASAISPNRVILQSREPGHVTASAPTDAAAGAATDPIAFYARNGGTGGCIRLNPAPADTTASTSWTFPVCGDFTLLGEPGLRLGAAVTGTDAEVNSRIWDIAPDGTATLVTRGAFRWTPSTTAINYAMQGTGWVFHANHMLRLQVTQNDAPYLRPDNYASAINYSSMRLTLPTTAPIGC